MRSKHEMSLALGMGLLLVCAPIFAHHGTGASYDTTKEVTLKGAVTKFVWSNPHCQIYFDVTDDNANVVHWAGEANSPGVLQAAGWSRTSLRPGDQITISLHPSKADSPVGELLKIVFEDGRCIQSFGQCSTK